MDELQSKRNKLIKLTVFLSNFIRNKVNFISKNIFYTPINGLII
jgi:hypothetical protein